MADPVVPSASPAPSPAPAATPAPAAAPAPSPAPAVTPAPSAAPAPAPSAAPAPAAPAAPVQPAAEAIKAAEPVKAADPATAEAPKAADTKTDSAASLLSDAGKPAPVDPAAKAEGEPAPVATEQPAQAPAPTYEPFKLPDGVTLQEKELGSFTGILGEFENGPKDHAATQAFGQKLIDLYTGEVQQLGTRLLQRQVEIWNDQNAQWKDEVRGDPELGGNRMATTLNVCGSVIEQYGGSPQQIAELRSAFNATGAGNHPAFVRLMHNIGKALGEGRPVPAPKPAPAPAGKAQRRYAGNTGQ